MPQTSVYIPDLLDSLSKDLDLDPFTVKTLHSRFKNEGMRFLTVTLPKLTKSVLFSLEHGRFVRPTEFRWKGRSLAFCASLLEEIFDHEGYPINNERSAHSLSRLRQLCDYFYKLSLSPSDKEVTTAEGKYLETERDLQTTKDAVAHDWVERLRKNFETYYKDLSNADIQTVFGQYSPRSTTGSFAGSSKLLVSTERGRLRVPYYVHKGRPASETGTCHQDLRAHSGYFRPQLGTKVPIFLERSSSDEKLCEVLFVPKDSRGPRVISKEPLNMLRAQMSYFDFMSKNLERLTRGRINFTRQEVSQQLAEASSVTKEYATLDLKDASDRVLYSVVRQIFRNSPALRWFITHTRSTHALMPSGKRIQLLKLAGMGSGLTFPTMALLIHLSVCTLVTRRTGIPYQEVMSSVYVYGDDLIVPRLWYDIAIESLQLSGLMVNTEKSFARGFFRESCGADYLFGVNVTPARLRLSGAKLPEAKELPRSGRVNLDDAGILQLERHCRELFKKGLYTLREYYYTRLERALGTLPTVSMTSHVLGRVDHSVYADRFTTSNYVAEAVTYSPKTDFGYQCPYKYLGKYLSTKQDTFLGIVPVSPALPYGVLSIPHMIKLKRRIVSNLDKDPVLVSSGIENPIADSLKRLSRFWTR